MIEKRAMESGRRLSWKRRRVYYVTIKSYAVLKLSGAHQVLRMGSTGVPADELETCTCWNCRARQRRTHLDHHVGGHDAECRTPGRSGLECRSSPHGLQRVGSLLVAAELLSVLWLLRRAAAVLSPALGLGPPPLAPLVRIRACLSS